MAAHRYWKLTITAVNGDASGYCAIGEVLGAESKGGANVLQGITVTVSSTAFSSPGTNINDGSRSTFWHSNTTPTPHTVTFDFGATAGNWKDVLELRITNRSGQTTTAPKDFTWAYSDDNSSYTTVITKTSQTSWSNPFTNVYHAAGCPEGTGYLFHRFTCTETDNTSATAVAGRAMELRETVGGADYTSSSTIASASSTSGTNSVDKLFDDNSSTFWSSASAPTQTVTIELPQAKPCLQMAWTGRSDFAGQEPRDFVLEGSKDRSTWTSEISVSGSSGWTLGETRTFNAAVSTGRRRQIVNC